MVATAFILGLAGSLHCAGMCGPLVLMTPVVGATPLFFALSRMVYHAGRLAIYALLGAVFGIIGESLVLAGLQRWLCIGVGILMLVVIFAAGPLKSRLWRMPAKLNSWFGVFLRKPSFSSIFALGAINGLLPCGLVYLAATASIAASGTLRSSLYMLAFGAGTLPVMLGISIAGHRLRFSARPSVQKIAPIAAAAVALLLILRAQPLSLLRGEPAGASCPACSR